MTEQFACPIKFSVAHAIPGRIRLHVPRIAADAHYLRRLTWLTESDVHIASVRVNPAAASLVVNYHGSVMAEAAMHARLADIIHAARDVVLPETDSESSSAPAHSTWQRLKLPALATGVAVLGSIGLPIPSLVIAGTVAIAATPITKRAMYSLTVEHRLNIDVLDVLALALTAVQGSFLAPAITVGLVELGEAIRERTARASRREASDLVASVKLFAWVERDGEKQQLPVDDVRRGDTVFVYPGDMIPVDGIVLDGKALIDEQHLTGESMLVLST